MEVEDLSFSMISFSMLRLNVSSSGKDSSKVISFVSSARDRATLSLKWAASSDDSEILVSKSDILPATAAMS